MAESTLSPKYSTLRADIGWKLGYTRTSAAWSDEQKAQINDCLMSGQRRFYNAAKWRFMEPSTELKTVPPYSTGTITIVAGVVTLAGGTFPTWAADGDLIVNNVAYSVNTYDGAGQVTLDDLSQAAPAGTTFELARLSYTMPDDFGGIVGPLQYVPENQRWVTVPLVNLADILNYRQWGVRSGTVREACVRPKAFDPTIGQRYEMLLWPMADAEYRLQFKYRAIPNAMEDDDFPLGGEVHGETIRLACLMVADEFINDGANLNVSKQAYVEALNRSIDFDSKLYAPDHMGYNRDDSDRPIYHNHGVCRGNQRGIRYNGTQYTDLGD